MLEIKVIEFTKSKVKRIVVSGDNQSYFIGCGDGSVHVIKALDFKHVDEYQFHTKNLKEEDSPVIEEEDYPVIEEEDSPVI